MAAPDLDARLLRFRSRPAGEDAARLATDLLTANRTGDALEVTASALASGETVEVLVIQGRAELALGKLMEAQATLLRAARVDGRRVEPFRWLGEVLLKRGDPARANKVLDRAAAIDPTDRAVAALRQRASRLAKIAESGGEVGDAPAPRTQEPPDDRTVVRADITSELALRERDAGDGEPADASAEDVGTAEDAEDEDEVTRIAAAPMARPVKAAPALAEPPRAMPPFGRPAPFAAPAPLAGPAAKLALAPPLAAAVPAAKAPLAAPSPFGTPAKAASSPFGAPLAAPSSTTGGPLAAPSPFGTPPKAAPSPFATPPKAAASPIARAATPASELGTRDGAKAPPPRESEPKFPELRAPAMGPAHRPVEPVREAERDGLRREEAAGLPALVSSLDDGSAPAWADEAQDGPPPEPEPDLLLGENAGEPADVDAILSMLAKEGIFEPSAGEAGAWAPAKEARTEKTRVGLWLALAWILALGSAGGGYYGWTRWVELRHAEAARLTELARTEAWRGDHERLVDAERHLREARDLDSHATDGPTLLLFVHAQRALEDGAFDVGFMAPSISRGERIHAGEAHLAAARAVVALGGGDLTGARTHVAAALAAAPEDAAILYVVGRCEQRLGEDDAVTHLEAAVAADPTLSAAAIALAELRHDEGRIEDAMTLLDAILARDPGNLRAQLWKAYLSAGDAEIDPAMAALASFEPGLAEHGAPTDVVLFQLTRARLLRRNGDHAGAVLAVDAALGAGAQEPRLLALAAQAARAEGRFLQAEMAATEAVRGSPSNPDFRKLLAAIYLDRRDGTRALSTLSELSAEDPDVLAMTAQAALLVGTEAATAGTAQAIDAWMTTHEDEASVELRSLRIRLELEISLDPAPALAAAQTLVTENPGDPLAARALGEAALRAHEDAAARTALETVVTSAPEDADGHWLLGRARRMGGDGVGARSSFERAIELRADHAEARVALAGLLLDLGEPEAADALYVELARAVGSAAGATLALTGRLGRVEALMALGRLDDAMVQLEQVREADRSNAAVALTSTRLSLARRQFGAAITTIRPLTEGETPSATALTLYGEALLGASQPGPAAEALDRALAIDAGLPEALLGRAEAYLEGGDERDALDTVDRVFESLDARVRPSSMRARAFVLRGRARIADRDEDEAVTPLRAATELSGCPADAWFFLGEALDDDEAASAYARYLELAPDGPHAAEARGHVE